jgi:hypothetical protein
MAGSVIALLPFIGLLVLAVTFFGFMHDNPERFFLCLILYFAFDSSTLFDVNLVINVNGLNIFVEDLLTLFLALELLFSLANRNFSKKIVSSKYRTLGKTYLLMSIIGIITWAYSEGIQTAVVNWRENLLCSLLILYCFSFNTWIKYEVFSSALYRGSVFLSVLILIRVILNGFGDFSEISVVSGITDRATTASGALFLLLALWNFLLQTRAFDFKSIAYIFVLATEILILQHRSVWLASLIGLSYLALRLENFRLRFRILTLISILTPLMSYVVINTSSLAAAASDSGTLTWRILRWQSSLGQSRSEIQTLFGGVVGHIDSITVAGLNVAAHNMYVSLFEKYGIVGVIVYLMILIPNKVKPEGNKGLRNLDLVSSLSLITFGFFYSFPYVAILVLFSIRRIRSEFEWRFDHAGPQKPS